MLQGREPSIAAWKGVLDSMVLPYYHGFRPKIPSPPHVKSERVEPTRSGIGCHR